MHQHHKENDNYTKTTLYSVVFESLLVKCAVFSLFILLLLQPVAPALASFEEGGDITTEAFVSPVFDTPEVFVEEVQVPEITPTEVTLGVTENVSEVEGSSGTTVTQVQATTTPIIPQDDEGGVIDDISSATSSETIQEDTQEGVVEEEIIETPESTATGTISTTSETIQPPIEKEKAVATSTIPKPTSTSTDAVFGRPAKAFEFDTKECASVGEGAYYCSTPKSIVDPLQDGVFAFPDQDGDVEIYVRVGGQENKLTDNTVDDSAPYFDAVSKRIVWHTSLNDRYQIVSYDTDTNEKTLITKTSYNNMEPVAYGDITLWQAWIGNNWEIMLYDGQAVVQLTNNTLQDVSPHMREGYVVWQTQFSDGWKVAVYDQNTKTIEYIASEGGMKVENPRFVLVYDSTNVQGDVQTVGYDLENKQSFTLGSLPAQLPEELPEPDQTGETRALIQNKQTSKEGDTEIIDIPVPSTVVGTSTASSSQNSASSTTLQISASTTTTSSVGFADVIIPSYTATTTVGQDVISIPDLVIPPVFATTTE